LTLLFTIWLPFFPFFLFPSTSPPLHFAIYILPWFFPSPQFTIWLCNLLFDIQIHFLFDYKIVLHSSVFPFIQYLRPFRAWIGWPFSTGRCPVLLHFGLSALTQNSLNYQYPILLFDFTIYYLTSPFFPFSFFLQPLPFAICISMSFS
jgi:hypothetical protein